MLTLEPLIEACGERFCTLQQLDPWSVMRWRANGFDCKDAKGICFFDGSTPTEAVQNLYDYLKENNLLNN